MLKYKSYALPVIGIINLLGSCSASYASNLSLKDFMFEAHNTSKKSNNSTSSSSSHGVDSKVDPQQTIIENTGHMGGSSMGTFKDPVEGAFFEMVVPDQPALTNLKATFPQLDNVCGRRFKLFYTEENNAFYKITYNTTSGIDPHAPKQAQQFGRFEEQSVPAGSDYRIAAIHQADVDTLIPGQDTRHQPLATKPIVGYFKYWILPAQSQIKVVPYNCTAGKIYLVDNESLLLDIGTPPKSASDNSHNK